MGYLEEMNLQLENQNFPGFIQLWEEYRGNNEILASEVIEILENVKDSEFKEPFGPYAEEALDLLDFLDDPEKKPAFLRLVLDLQTTNSEKLARYALDCLESCYKDQPNFRDKLRLIGLRKKINFQGAIRNFELLNHMEKGRFIYHTGGWGVGEIMDISLIREQLAVEFENVAGVKEVSFKNAFNNLVPVSSDHFLARRFGDPDALEAEARANPLDVLTTLLADVGPLNAQEIKEEMHELVIPAADWSKWWQNARSKLKKDPKVQSPTSLSEPFVLLDKEISRIDSFKLLVEKEVDLEEFLKETYQYVKHYPEVLKNTELKALYREELLKKLNQLQDSQDLLKVQIYILLEDLFEDQLNPALTKILEQSIDIHYLIKSLVINSLKKKLLQVIRKVRTDWVEIFSESFLNIPQHFLREYTLKELSSGPDNSALKNAVKKLLEHPTIYPECFTWYFQKVQLGNELPFSDLEGKRLFFENLFILLYHIESTAEHSDLVKKIHGIICKKHFQLFRDNIAEAPIDFVQEVLLLITKCQMFNSHDYKVFLALAKVVHPDLDDDSAESELDEAESIVWTTQEGYKKIQDRIHHIATIETVENAKEIEVARSYGDLRENSEYKFAQEKRARLQSEMKLLTSQLGLARIISPDDINRDTVGVGAIVDLLNSKGKKLKYTILGPWDADPDKFILSFQSQLAKSMTGHKVEETFKFKDDSYTITKIKSYLEK